MSKRRKSDRTPTPVLDDVAVKALLEALAPLALPAVRAAALRERVIQHARAPKPGTQPELLTIRADEGWKAIARGVEMKDLYIDAVSRTRSFLARMQPGSTLPGHDHAGDEECMILEGEVSLGGIIVRAGDYHMAPKGVPHGTVTTNTGALLYVRAAMADLERLDL